MESQKNITAHAQVQLICLQGKYRGLTYWIIYG